MGFDCSKYTVMHLNSPGHPDPYDLIGLGYQRTSDSKTGYCS